VHCKTQHLALNLVLFSESNLKMLVLHCICRQQMWRQRPMHLSCFKMFTSRRARTAEANRIQCEFVHFFLPFGIGRVWNVLCYEPYIKEQLINAEVLPSPASCFLRYLGCRFKLSFGNFGADIVAVQLFVNELGHPQGLMSTLFDNFYREDVGFRLCSLLCCLHDKKHFWQVPLFFLGYINKKGLNDELLPGRIPPIMNL
jgi:hypothetical protein